MKRTRRRFTNEFKAKITIEAIQERHVLCEPAERFKTQTTQWENKFSDKTLGVFSVK